jgi:hypothetical protein
MIAFEYLAGCTVEVAELVPTVHHLAGFVVRRSLP